MSHYIPISSVEVADLLSRRLYNLTRPTAKSTTTHLLSWVVHPDTGEVRMQIPEEYDIPVHMSANAEEIRPILQPFIDAGNLTKTEVDALVKKVSDSSGQRIMVWDLIPGFWKNLSMSREDLERDGWFLKIEEK